MGTQIIPKVEAVVSTFCSFLMHVLGVIKRNTTFGTGLSPKAALLYTPDREHFGIVPVEAMYVRSWRGVSNFCSAL